MLDRVPLSQVEDKPEIKDTKPVVNNRITATTFLDDIEYHRMADAFDISSDDRKDEDLANKLSLLTEWGEKTTGKKERIHTLLALKDLQKRIGFQEVGKEAVKKLYKWIRLDLDRQRIEKEMQVI